jgi:pyrroline-5-carboxylate reductase
MKIAFIGGGNMGEAMLAALIEKKICLPAAICVSDVSAERRQYINNRYGVPVTGRNGEAVAGKDIIVLAVKPQTLPEVLPDLKGSLQSSQLVLSIIAGATIRKIGEGLGHQRLVRAMPNTPARIGYGVTGWTATQEVTVRQKESARSVLGAMGKEIYFGDEKFLDMVTAVSGSGPAYFFLLAEALIEAAVKIGLPLQEAEGLVTQTMLGSAQLLVRSGRPPAELRRNVTSRGGTTEAALNVFEKGGFSRLVADAVKAAYKRAQELGKTSSQAGSQEINRD